LNCYPCQNGNRKNRLNVSQTFIQLKQICHYQFRFATSGSGKKIITGVGKKAAKITENTLSARFTHPYNGLKNAALLQS
jgi:hypothetical protein